jgi:hypothetical protein
MRSGTCFQVDHAVSSKARRALAIALFASLLFVPSASLAIPVQYTFSGTLASNTGSDPLLLQGASLRSDVFADTSDLPVFVGGAETITARYTPASAVTSIAGRPGGAADFAIASPGPLVTANSYQITGDLLEWGASTVSFPDSATQIRLPFFSATLFIDSAPGEVAPLPLFYAADLQVAVADRLLPADFSNSFSYRLTNVSVTSAVVPEPGTAGLVIGALVLIARCVRSTSGSGHSTGSAESDSQSFRRDR